MHNGLDTRIELVTPEQAIAMLASNRDNRKLRSNLVDKYAADMAAGDWKLNGEPLILDEEDGLLDGQHRLTAQIKAKKSVTYLIVRGVPREDRSTIDGGVSRTIADRLHFEGYGNVTLLAARATVILSIEHGARVRVTPSLAQVKGSIGRHTEGLSWVQGIFPNGHGTGLSAVAGALAYCLPTNRESVMAFAEKLRDGIGLQRGDPAYHFREWVLNIAVKRDVRMETSAGLMRSLFAYLHHEVVYQVKPGVVLGTDWWPRLLKFFGEAHKRSL